MKVAQSCNLLIDNYPYHNELKDEVLSLLEKTKSIPRDHSNVKAFHTDWDWEPKNLKIKNLKSFIISELKKFYRIAFKDGTSYPIVCKNFWANVYSKGDYAEIHDHVPFHFSFAYFLKCEEYHSPLFFSESGRGVLPSEGRFVVFPSHLKHHVPEQMHDDTRVTLSGNFYVQI